jgi:hypothetical protein
MTPRVEESNAWARLELLSSPVLEQIKALAGEMTGAQEPQRMRTWPAAWAACGVRLRRRWLALLGVHTSDLTNAEIRGLSLIEVPYGGCSRCHPDLAIVRERPVVTNCEHGDASHLRPVRVIAILEAKVRAYAAINWVTACSAFDVADEAALPSRLRALVSEGGIDQLTLYRWGGEYVYPPDWDFAGAAFVLVTPGNCYAVPDGWVGADMEAVATLLLKAAEHSGSDVFARAVAALIAPSRTYDWRGITASGTRRAYATFGIKRSWDAWLGRIEIIYRVGADFGLALRARGWVPVSFDGVELEPIALPVEILAAYAEALEDHGDRAAWLTCTFGDCGAAVEAACGHVDVHGYHVSSRPPLAVLPGNPVVPT